VCTHRSPHLAFRPATRSTIARSTSRPAVGARHLAASTLPGLSRTCAVRSPARLLRNTTTHVVELVPIPKTNSNTSRQQHNGSELQSSPSQRRGAANPRTSRRRLRPLAQHRPNRRLLLLRRLHHSQAPAARVAAMHMTNSVHPVYGLDNSNLRTHSPNHLLLITRSQANLIPRFLLSAFQLFPLGVLPGAVGDDDTPAG
jgi:hypothetical protein